MSGGPIFIVGAMGSGTTLLRLVLDSHPNIAIPRETGFMRAYKAHRFAPFKHSGRDWTRRLGWEHEDFLAYMRSFYDGLFMRYAAQHGKTRWGEKTPSHTWHIDDMAELFPDAQFIAMVRHPLGSAASNISRFGTGPRKAVSHWTRYSRELARQATRYPDRFVLLRYEDLLLRPEPTLRELLEWLDEPWSDAVLAHHEVQGERDAPRKVEGRTRPDEALDRSRIDKWTRVLGDERRQWLARRFRRYAGFFGYAVDDPAVLEPIGDPDRILIHPAEIDERIDQFPHLKIREPVPLTPYEMLYDPRVMMVLRRDEYKKLLEPPQRHGYAVRIARRLPPEPRRLLLRAVRRTRSALGERKRPRMRR